MTDTTQGVPFIDPKSLRELVASVVLHSVWS